MARVFSVPTALRQFPKPLLGELFAALGVPARGIDWESLRPHRVRPIQDALARLPEAGLNRVEGELRAVFDLACEAGFDALVETAASLGHHDLADAFGPGHGFYHRALWVRVRHPEYFETAGALFQVDQLSWWDKRPGLPTGTLDVRPAVLTGLQTGIAAVLMEHQGRGRRCTVEHRQRGEVHYFFAYPDDFVQSVQEHDAAGTLRPRALRRTFEMVFAYHSGEGTLELYAKVLRKLKPVLEAAFARVVLGEEVDAWRPTAAFRLQHLQPRETRLFADPADAVGVALRRLKLQVKGTNRRIQLEADPDEGEDGIHAMMDECLNRRRLRPEDLIVKSATIVFEFGELRGRKAGTARVDVSQTGTSGLRHLRPEWQEAIQKYLRAWGIDGRPDDLPPPAARPGRAALAG